MSRAATVLLVRHGNTADTGIRLTGWSPGVALNELGHAQATHLAERLADVELTAIVSSPLQRCRETAEAIGAAQSSAAQSSAVRPTVELDPGVGECDYGDWTGRELRELVTEPEWRLVQDHPSAARFPGGESLAETSHRAVRAVRGHINRLHQTWAHPTVLVCSHGDVIKAIVADAMGLHLDLFQRIQVDPCSLSAIRYTTTRPFLLRVNDTGGTVTDLIAHPGDVSTDATVGGGAGSSEAT